MFRVFVIETQLLWTWVSTIEYRTFHMSTLTNTIYQSRFRERSCKINIGGPGPCMYVYLSPLASTLPWVVCTCFLVFLWHFAGTLFNLFWGHPRTQKASSGAVRWQRHHPVNWLQEQNRCLPVQLRSCGISFDFCIIWNLILDREGREIPVNLTAIAIEDNMGQCHLKIDSQAIQHEAELSQG